MVISPIPTLKTSSLTKGRIDPRIYDTFIENILKQAGHTLMLRCACHCSILVTQV